MNIVSSVVSIASNVCISIKKKKKLDEYNFPILTLPHYNFR